MTWLGLDIGGANIKFADGRGYAHSEPFALWRHPNELSSKLHELLTQAPAAKSLAVTMTGELADCYETKTEGVLHILHAVEHAANGRDMQVYQCNGQLTSIKDASREPLLSAASNWHVLATYSMRHLQDDSGLLIDIGSTTTDLIPLGNEILPKATDPQRLAEGSLVYTGVQRSPLCAIVAELPWNGKSCRVAQELFATTQDAYVVLDKIVEQPQNSDTADGRPLTKAYSHARLARSVCADTSIFSWAEAIEAAKVVCRNQVNMIVDAAHQVLDYQPTTIVISGQGEFLARLVFDRLGFNCQIISLSEQLGSEISHCACAHALAVLASERFSL